MKKLMLVFTILISILLFNCSKDETESYTPDEQTDYIQNKLADQYGFKSLVDFNQIDLSGFSTEMNLPASARGFCLHFEDPSIKVYAFQDPKINRKFSIFKTLETEDGESIQFEGQVEISINSSGTGFVELNKDGQSVRVYFENNKINRHLTFSLVGNPKAFMAGFWCQKLKSESFKSCFARESAEFCTDFVSTVAYYTNMSIPVLIAGMCTC